MPYPASMLASFKRRYGEREGTSFFHGYRKAHPQRYAKALRTATREGRGHVVAHSTSRKRRRAGRRRNSARRARA